MTWILVALLSPALHAVANEFDAYLTNRFFRRPFTIAFYSTLMGILFLPLVFLVERPYLPSLQVIPFLIIAGLADVLYLYPYYKALQVDDTSTVASLFSLGKISVPVLAFLFVHERLTLTQYLGVALILISSTLLTLKHKKRFSFNKSFWYMGICALILAIESVVYKYVFEQVSWATGFTWSTISSFIVVACMLVVPSVRRDIAAHMKSFRRHGHLVFVEELFTFAGSAAGTFAIALAPVTLVESIGEIQPFFVLVAALLVYPFYPRMFKEHIDGHSIEKKIALFVLTAVGVLLVTRS